MIQFRQILAKIFAGAAYAVLDFAGWKRKTVEANLRHISRGTWGSRETESGKDVADSEPRELYKKMLRNLTRHVGEMLFCFDTYKNLPEDCTAYPCKRDGCIFDISADSRAVIEKMRKGGIFLTAHYGNYEASGAWLCALGVPLKASFIPLKPDWLNKIVYEKIRCVKGRPYSIDAKTPREFLKLLDGKSPRDEKFLDSNSEKKQAKSRGDEQPRKSQTEGRQLFCLLADQDSRISSAMDGTFLGRPAKINPLPDFLLKHRPDTPVYFCWIEELDERGKSGGRPRKILHAVEAEKLDSRLRENDCNIRENDNPLRDNNDSPMRHISRNASSRMTSGKNASGSIVDGAYRNWLEERIAENPALWYGWTHRRFRSKNPEIYG